MIRRIRDWLAQREAQRRAEEACLRYCRELRPHEPVHHTSTITEPDRFVVLVFLGTRDEPMKLGPPWAECWVLAVVQPTAGDYRVNALPELRRLDGVEAEPYRPVLR